MTLLTRISVVGFGLVGRRHADVVLRSRRMDLAAIVDTAPAPLAMARDLDVPVYDDMASMIKNVRPDGIILATPTLQHVDQAIEALNAGVPVLVEKPIAATAQEARKLIDVSETKGVPVLVGHHRRYAGQVQAAHTAITQGALGDLRSAQATCWFYKPDSYFEAAPWRTKAGAGPISVNLVHDVDVLRYLCGDVEAVQAMSAPATRGFENEDLATAVLRFASGVIASITVSDSVVAPWSWEMTAGENPVYPATSESCYWIGGSRGALSIPDLRIWRHEGPPDWWSPITDTRLAFRSHDPLEAQVMHFADVISGNAAPLVSGLEGLRSLEVVEAISLAALTRTEVQIRKA